MLCTQPGVEKLARQRKPVNVATMSTSRSLTFPVKWHFYGHKIHKLGLHPIRWQRINLIPATLHSENGADMDETWMRREAYFVVSLDTAKGKATFSRFGA
jgi:hypothetical protein